ncbi:hypothetical protein HY992_04030 [Candidatus Micrarchaeota archaeon]|nr:hypothetical protein [Candidatus Micrarchaeota archaeon]
MPLEELREEILEKSKKETYEVLKEADLEAKKVLLDAKTRGEQEIENARQEATKVIERQKSERLSAARLEAKMILAEAKEESVKAVQEEAWNSLEKIRKGRDYEKLLRELIQKATDAIDGIAVIHANKQDLKTAKKIVEEIRTATVSNDAIDCAGGALVTSKDGRVRVDATFEAMFQEHDEYMRRTAYAELFETRKKKEEKTTGANTEEKPKKTSKQATKKTKQKKKK